MITVGYEICLILSLVIILYISLKDYEKIDVYYCAMILLIPIVILGYWLKSRVTSPAAAEMAFCFIYIDSTILLVVTLFSMLRSFNIPIKPWMKITGYTTAIAHCFLVWQCYGTGLYYSSIDLVKVRGATATKVHAGPLKFIHTIYLAVIILLIIGAVVNAFIRKGTYSRKVLYNYAIICLIGIGIYAVEMFVDVNFSSLPFLYVLIEFLIAMDYDNIHIHDVSSLISEQQMTYGNKGYFAIDTKRRFLTCNDRAYNFFEFLKNQRRDEILSDAQQWFLDMVDEYEKNGTASRKFKIKDITCVCEIMSFSVRKDHKKQGYLFELRDATEEQKVLDVMEAYNTTLNAEVMAKTRHISDIQRKIVIGMANIIENRDNNTGGHVKRTSDVITILVEEATKRGKVTVDEVFAADVIRAAPMHDLGKVSVDSTILCKPARLDPDEYAIMKTHAEKSSEMVKILLDGIEEDHFVNVAYNVAKYHHERWDGKGYPEGLVGSMIPLEARLMAIADVYDALVSKRCYKEPMSFAKAKDIMCEGMGTQFDPNLRDLFLSSLDRLEDYYRQNNNT